MKLENDLRLPINTDFFNRGLFTALLCIFTCLIPLKAVTGKVNVKGEAMFSLGLSVPLGPTAFSDWWNPGLQFTIGGGVGVGQHVTFLGALDYNRFTFDEKDYAASFGIPPGIVFVTGGNSNIFSIIGGANIYAIPRIKPISPYFTGRLGFIRHHIDDAVITIPGNAAFIPSETRTGFLLYVGAGLAVNTGQYVDLFAEIKYGIGMMNRTDNREILPINVGMTFKF